MSRLPRYGGLPIFDFVLVTLVATGCLAKCETPWKYCGTSGKCLMNIEYQVRSGASARVQVPLMG